MTTGHQERHLPGIPVTVPIEAAVPRESVPLSAAAVRAALGPSTVIIAVVAGAAAFEPTLVLRAGAVLCALAAALRFRTLTIGLLDWAVVSLALLSAASLGWTRDHELTRLTTLNYVAVAAIFVSVRAVVTTLAQTVVVISGYLLGCAAAAVLLFRENRGVAFVPELTAERAAITGLNPNYLSYALATGAVLALVLLTLRRLRLLALSSMVLIAWAVLVSGSRGGLLALALLAGWAGLSRFAARLAFRLLLALVLGAALAIATGLSDRFLVLLDANTVRSTGDLTGRLVIWPLARELLAAHPWFGIGAGSFAGRNTYGIGAHNVVLEVGTGMGLVGVVLFGLILWGALVRSSAGLPPARRNLIVGSLILTWTPLYLSGHWELSPAAWLMLALFSRLGPQLTPARS